MSDDGQIRAPYRERVERDYPQVGASAWGRRIRRYGIERFIDFDVAYAMLRELQTGFTLVRWRKSRSPRVQAAIVAARAALSELVDALVADWQEHDRG